MSKLSKILFLCSALCVLSFILVRVLIGAWVPFLWIPIGLFILFIVIALWKDRVFYSDFLSMKTTKKGMSMGSVIFLTLLLVIAVNFLGARKYKTFDFSATKVNTLSDQSIKIVKSFTEDCKVIYFYKEGDKGVDENRKAFTELIKKYQDQTAFVKLEFVEVNERPDLTEKYGITKASGIVFVDYKGRTSRIEKIDEQELTGAFVKVTRDKDKTIYFTVGHGERDLEDATTSEGLGVLKQLLEGNRYVIKSLPLMQSPQIPKDADLVVVAGPTQAFMDFEDKALVEFLKSGGSLVLALEGKPSLGLNELFKQTGLEIKNNYVVTVMDTALGKVINPSATTVTDFSAGHQITQPFGKNQAIIMRLPAALHSNPTNEMLTWVDFLKVSEASYGYDEKEFKKEGIKGPFVVGMVGTTKVPPDQQPKSPVMQARFVVLGDSEVMTNQLLYQNLNRDLVLNTMAYLSKDENLISIIPKEVSVTQMDITEGQWIMFLFFFLIPMPIFFLVTSGVLWFKRRHA